MTKEQIIQFLYCSNRTMDSKQLQQLYRKAHTKQIDLGALHKLVPKVKPDMKFLAAETQSVQAALDSAHLKPESVRSIPSFNFNTVIKDIAKDNMGYLNREVVQRVEEHKRRQAAAATSLKKSHTVAAKESKTHKREGSSEILIPEYSAYSPDSIVSVPRGHVDQEDSKKSSFPSSHHLQSMKHIAEVGQPSVVENSQAAKDAKHKKHKSIGFTLPATADVAEIVEKDTAPAPKTQFTPPEEVLTNLRQMYIDSTEPTTASKDYAIHDLICRVVCLLT